LNFLKLKELYWASAFISER